MRVIGTLSHENEARRLTQYLTSQGIANNCEVSFDAATGQMSYQLWIHEEDKMGAATALFEEFFKKPQDRKFDPPPSEPSAIAEEMEMPPLPRQFKTYFTFFILGVCTLFFFFNTLQEIPLEKGGQSSQLTPIQMMFVYDLPPGFATEGTPYWRGVYDWVVHKIRGESTAPGEGPLFIKERQGEVWRLFTPVLLHQDLLHILFNMLWLWYLGRPIEQRIGSLRTIVFTLIAAVGSNTVQYFMSGPLFIGYSGVITAMAGFIWMRQRMAPWEGYPISKATLLFLLFFITAIFILQVVAFSIQVSSNHNFAPNIANTAHIGGAFIGAWLARFHFFAQRIPR